MTEISVIVPARNAAATIERTLAALAQQDIRAGGFEVIVVDDASTDETAAIATRSSLRPTVICSQSNEGPGAARNLGASKASGSYLAFTDADCEPTRHWLASGVKALRDADLVQGQVEPVNADVGPFDRTIRVSAERGLYETANLFVRRDLFEDLGGFEDWILNDRPKSLLARGKVGSPEALSRRSFGEDVLFGWRARRAGARTAFARRAVVLHAIFAQGPRGFIRERMRLLFFPALARRVPELRDDLFFWRYFLTSRSACFDLAVMAILVAAIAKSPIPLIAMAPYIWKLLLGARRGGIMRIAPIAVVDLLADAVAFFSLLRGSLVYRAPLL